MATAGVKRKPDNILKLQGTHRKDRHGEIENKPQIADPVGDPPEWMAGEARAEFTRVAALLDKAHVVTGADRSVLCQYAELWAQFVEERKDFTASKHVQLRMCAVELGLTPSARSRLPAHTVNPPGDFNEF